jgi:hypothetical protein
VAAANKGIAQGFDHEKWIDAGTVDAGRNIRQITDDGGSEWRDFIKALSTALAVLKDESKEAAKDFGLPVDDALAAMRSIHETRLAERKREAEQKAEQERIARVEALVQAAQAALGDDGLTWLDDPQTFLRGLTPRIAAAESAGQLANAKWRLQGHQEECELKATWIDALKREAYNLFRREDKVAVYMTSGDPSLPGHASPYAHTKNETTMRECLTLLKKRFGKS